ncbi:LuxR family transcriptional regulator, maltose regulon positive regulatory protein [Novosphingobium sp. PP1Y]|nr:LuxR family transcriptional regulator, maltose regulon positive regulatory protein [Novosphingobium sp. PP1Y]
MPGATETPRFKGKWIAPPGIARLAEKLTTHSVVLITAAPGSGKTRLMQRIHTNLQSFLYSCCWLRLQRGRDTSGSLFMDVAAVLVSRVLGERSATAALLTAHAIAPDTVIAVALNEIAARDGEVALFLDDIHVLTETGIAELQRIIDNAPNNLRLVIAARGPTRLHLARLRNADAVLEVDDAALAISFKQLNEMVAELSVPALSLAEARDLWSRSGGWVAAVRLLVRNRPPPNRTSGSTGAFAIIGRDLQEYFEEELLSGLSDEARGALDVMLIPNRLEHGLMLELSADPQAPLHIQEYLMHGLLKRNPFGPEVTYTTVPLLLDVVAVKSFVDTEERASLHRRSCGWFEKRGNFALAASHAMDSGDSQRAVALIERCGFDMISRGEVLRLQAWLDRFSISDLQPHPTALLAVAWALALLYRLDEAEKLLTALDTTFKCDLANFAGHERNLTALRIMIASMRDDFRQGSALGRSWKRRWPESHDWFSNVVDNSLAFCLAHEGAPIEGRMALERAYLPSYYETSPYGALYGRCILGLIDLRDGQVRHAETHFNWALKHAERDMSAQSTGTVMAAGLLAGALYERNETGKVTQLIESYAWSLHAHLFTDARFQAYRAKARNLSNNGQYRAAITVLENVLDAGPAVRLPRVRVDVLCEKVVISVMHHDTRMAAAYVRALSELSGTITDDDRLAPYLEAAVHGSQAHLYIALGAPERALELLRRAARLDLSDGWNLRALHWAVLGVSALNALGRTDLAIRLLRRLIRQAAGNGIVRTFVDGGHAIQAVLDMMHARGMAPRGRREAMLVQQLRETFDPSLAEPEFDEKNSLAQPGNALTEREIELVHFVRAGLTNRQIAEQLDVSENTVKWHLKNVFEKVNVRRRADLTNIDLA